MKRLRVLLTLITFAALPAFSQSERSLIREGNKHYNDSKFDDAEVSYKKALEKNKELHEGAFNLGDALYKQERFGEAAEQYQIAATRTKDAAEKAQALHNLGNSYVKSQQYPQAVSAYKNALKENPNDADTKYNLEYAKQMLKQQQQQQQQQKDQKKDDKKKQDKNDKQKQQDDKNKDEQKKEDQQKQDQKKQDQQKQDQKNQQQESQPKKQQISKQDAERILEALKNEEKDVQKKLHKRAPARVRVEKDW